MRRPPLLLHLLVSLALFLNGIGSAQASVRMLMAQAAATSQHVGRAASGHEPQHHCHESGAAATHAHPSSPHSDCCKSANCHCGCVNHVQLAWTVTLPLLANTTHAGPPRALQPGHAAAALPHLIRPPISQA